MLIAAGDLGSVCRVCRYSCHESSSAPRCEQAYRLHSVRECRCLISTRPIRVVSMSKDNTFRDDTKLRHCQKQCEAVFFQVELSSNLLCILKFQPLNCIIWSKVLQIAFIHTRVCLCNIGQTTTSITNALCWFSGLFPLHWEASFFERLVLGLTWCFCFYSRAQSNLEPGNWLSRQKGTKEDVLLLCTKVFNYQTIQQSSAPIFTYAVGRGLAFKTTAENTQVNFCGYYRQAERSRWTWKRFSPSAAKQWENWLGHVHMLPKEEVNKLSSYMLSMTVRIRAGEPSGKSHAVMIKDTEPASLCVSAVWGWALPLNQPVPDERSCLFQQQPVRELDQKRTAFCHQPIILFDNW